MFYIEEERRGVLTNFTNGSARRIAKQIMDFKEERIQSILSGPNVDPELKKEILKNIIKNRVERGRKNA